jgi:hypothetical protein
MQVTTMAIICLYQEMKNDTCSKPCRENDHMDLHWWTHATDAGVHVD